MGLCCCHAVLAMHRKRLSLQYPVWWQALNGWSFEEPKAICRAARESLALPKPVQDCIKPANSTETKLHNSYNDNFWMSKKLIQNLRICDPQSDSSKWFPVKIAIHLGFKLLSLFWLAFESQTEWLLVWLVPSRYVAAFGFQIQQKLMHGTEAFFLVETCTQAIGEKAVASEVSRSHLLDVGVGLVSNRGAISSCSISFHTVRSNEKRALHLHCISSWICWGKSPTPSHQDMPDSRSRPHPW